MTVLITLHALVTLALIVVVLMQKRNTGALGGLAGQSNPSRMTTPRASSNPLAKLTTWLAVVFIGLSLVLAYVSKGQKNDPTQALSEAVKATTLPMEGTPAPANPAAPSSPAPAKPLNLDLETPAAPAQPAPFEAKPEPKPEPQPESKAKPAPDASEPQSSPSSAP
jgi:preprotein translocase subunit SecG